VPFRLVLVVVFVAVGLTACGGKSKQPLVGKSATTVGTVSANVARSAIVKDAVAIRSALNSGRASAEITGIYALLSRADAEKNVEKSAAMIRAQLPSHVRIFLTSYPAVRARLLSLKLISPGGRAFRNWALGVMTEWSKGLPRFRDDVASSANTWRAVARFAVRNNAMRGRLSNQLSRLVANLPADQRKTLMLAVKQTFGGQ
jgi:hypothetical protein